MIITWDNAFGVFALFGLSYAGIRWFDDMKIRVAALGLGVGLAALLAGLDPASLVSGGQAFLQNSANQAGFVTSTLALSLTPMVPISSARKTTMSLGAAGVATSLFGFPSWIIWIIVSGVLITLGFASYKLISKGLDILQLWLNHVKDVKGKVIE